MLKRYPLKGMPFYVVINEDRSCYLYWQVKYCAKQDPYLSTCLLVYMSTCLSTWRLPTWLAPACRLATWLASWMPACLCLSGCLVACADACLYTCLALLDYQVVPVRVPHVLKPVVLFRDGAHIAPVYLASRFAIRHVQFNLAASAHLPSSRLKRKSSGKPSAGIIPLSSPTR